MNHAEKANFHEESTSYLAEHQVREKFQRALAELVLKQPNDPIEFLSKHFKQRKQFLMFSVVSVLQKDRESVVQDLAHEYNLKVIKIDQDSARGIEAVDNNDYSQLFNSLSKFESNFDGLVFDNFPSTKVNYSKLDAIESFQEGKTHV